MRLKQIADTETKKSGGKVNKETMAQIAKLNYPDMRAMINEMQYNFDSNEGSIDGEIVSVSLEHIKELWELIKSTGDMLTVRKYYTEYISDLNGLFLPFMDYVIDNDYETVKPYVCSLTSVVAQHQFQSSFDSMIPEVNVAGMMGKIIRLVHA